MKRNIQQTQLTWLALAAVLLLTALPTQAMRYLTPMQAQKLCFPEADKFEWQQRKFTAAEAAQIQKASGVPLKLPGAWYAIAMKDGQVIGAVIIDRVKGKHEAIDFAVALDAVGKVRCIEILEYRESIGDEVRRAGWRNQFQAKDNRSKLKLNDDIANIAGATISCRNVTEGVRRVCHTWQLVLRPALVSAKRLPKLAAR
ncbi:MAG: FMN-binding protein [Verrucomicrobia subdivision 3 bacterium]|nr:FMN-binding protein [Limisphaerales bacterium]